MLDSYVVVDLEMTGVQAHKDSVIEIGAVRYDHGHIDTYQTLVKPRTRIKDNIIAVTNITNEMVEADGIDTDTAMQAFLDFAGDRVLIGHMLSIDYSFIKQWCINKKIDYTAQGVDTLFIARKFLADLPSRKLSDLIEYYDMGIDVHHRALADAEATNILYRCLCTEFEDGNEKDFLPKGLNYTGKKQTPATGHQIEYLEKLCSTKGIALPENYKEFTRSEMSRETDKLIAKYGKLDKNK